MPNARDEREPQESFAHDALLLLKGSFKRIGLSKNVGGIIRRLDKTDEARILKEFSCGGGCDPGELGDPLLVGLSSQATASSTSNKGSIFTASKRSAGLLLTVFAELGKVNSS